MPKRSPPWAWSAASRSAGATSIAITWRQQRPRQRRRRRPRRDVEGAAHAAAVRHPRGRRLAGDQSAIDRRHHHRRLDPRRRARWRRSISPSPTGAASSPRGKAGSGCRSLLGAPAAADPRRCRCKPPAKTLVVQNAAVAPPGEQKIVCQDVNFSLDAGKALGVIGPTASGKSSLARMLVGVWTPVRGSVRLDGASLDQWSPEALGRHIGYLPQDVELFPGTVAQNIARFEDPPDAGGRARRRAGRRRPRSHRQSAAKATRPMSATTAARCRPARRSASRWRARSIAIRSWSCSTSRIPISTPKATKR